MIWVGNKKELVYYVLFLAVLVLPSVGAIQLKEVGSTSFQGVTIGAPYNGGVLVEDHVVNFLNAFLNGN